MLRSIITTKLVLRKICKDIVCNTNNNNNKIMRNNYSSISTFSTLAFNNKNNNITKRVLPSSLSRNVRYFSLVTEQLESLG